MAAAKGVASVSMPNQCGRASANNDNRLTDASVFRVNARPMRRQANQ